MKLSTRGRYATRALLDLALHSAEEPVLIKDIARRQAISPRYLEHLVTPLISSGILRSTRGARGGISLVKPPAQIKLGEVIQLLEGPIAPVECVIKPEVCARSRSCVTRDVWCELKDAIDGVLDTTTLQDLMERQKQAEQSKEEMYYI